MLLHSSSGCRFHIFAHADCYFRTKFPLFHMPAEREAFNLEIDTQSMSWNHIHKYRNGLYVTFLNYYTAIGKLFKEEMLFTWRFWRLTLWLIILYSLWNDEIKLCILSPYLYCISNTSFYYWLKEFPFNKLYSFSLNFLYLNLYIFCDR